MWPMGLLLMFSVITYQHLGPDLWYGQIIHMCRLVKGCLICPSTSTLCLCCYQDTANFMLHCSTSVPASIEGSEQLQTVWVAVNNPLTLECPAEGTPTPKIYWMRQGQVIQAYGNPSVRIEDNGRKLLLVSAQLPDLGDYKCLAENVAGNDSIEYLVSVYGKVFQLHVFEIWQNESHTS